MHQRFRRMGVEIVDDEDPFAVQVGRHRLQHVIGEVLFAARRAQRRGQDATGGDLEIGDQSLGAVADVVRLLPFDESGDRGLGRMPALQGLHPGLLVTADQMHALLVQRRGLLIQSADGGHLLVKPRRVLRRRMQPGAGPVRLTVRLILKNAPPFGSRCSAQSAVSPPLRPPRGGVQWDTGRCETSGGSQAMARMPMICSGVKSVGAPGRGASASVATTQRRKSEASALSSAACNRSRAAAQRRRQRPTVSPSTPKVGARSWLRPPPAAASTIRARCTSRCSRVGQRTQCCRISRCRALNSMEGATRTSTYSLDFPCQGRPSWREKGSSRGGSSPPKR